MEKISGVTQSAEAMAVICFQKRFKPAIMSQGIKCFRFGNRCQTSLDKDQTLSALSDGVHKVLHLQVVNTFEFGTSCAGRMHGASYEWTD